MKSAVALPLVFAALLLAGCGGEPSSATSKPGAAPQPPATARPSQTDTGTAQMDPAMPDEEMEEGGTGELLQTLEDLPTQDELDAAAETRITEATADAEYEKLKAEIEEDLANPPAEDG